MLFQKRVDSERTWWMLFQKRVDSERTWWMLFQKRFDSERTWWMLFQKRVVRTKFDIYVFICFIDTMRFPVWYLLQYKKIKIGPYVFRSIIIRWKWKQLVLSYILHFFKLHLTKGPSWSCSYDSWIYNYLCNQYLVLLALWVRVSLMGRCTRYNIMW